MSAATNVRISLWFILGLFVCRSRWNVGHRPLHSIQLCPVLSHPSSSSWIWNLPFTYLSPRFFPGRCSLVFLFLWLCVVHYSACLAMSSSFLANVCLLLQELVEDVAVATSSRHADLSWARRFAVAGPRFIGRRSASTVLSQDCLGWPVLCLQWPGGSIMQAWRARWWSCRVSARWRCPKNDRRRLRTVSDRSGCPMRERISSLVTNSAVCVPVIKLAVSLRLNWPLTCCPDAFSVFIITRACSWYLLFQHKLAAKHAVI